MRKINYQIKHTSAGTDYVILNQEDHEHIQVTLMGLLCALSELTVSKNSEIRDFTNWFTKKSSQWHRNSKLKSSNSPQSYLAGTLNNIMFGNQREFTLTQLETLQTIINLSVDCLQAIQDDLDITIQHKPLYSKIFTKIDLFER